ncbi:MAG: hypothetical protein KDI71_16855 [Xanthomonadales bacterium]|nr:hypothetical protein [Xanthomonadales bacterium]
MRKSTNAFADGELRAMDFLSRAQSRLCEASQAGDPSASNALAHVRNTLERRDQYTKPSPASQNAPPRH